MNTAIGTTFFGTIDGYRFCEYPDCSNRFKPRTVQVKFCPEHRGPSAGRYAKNAGPYEPEFIAIDGEGMGSGRDHKYVLLGVGQNQIRWPDGLRDCTEAFAFLYGEFERKPNAVYVGFYLAYDFNMWLRVLPRDRAWYLLTTDGQGKRKHKCKCSGPCTHSRLAPHPVEYKGWQFDMLAMKRFRLRPKDCGCPQVTCKCTKKPWMYINDAGPFFQASLLTVINPKDWREPVVSQEEYELIKAGKDKRDSAILDDDMERYNRLENDVLSRLMSRLNQGLDKAGVRLNKRQWFGPGQAAQAWMHIDKKLERTTEAVRALPKAIRDAAIATYYGGWFEIPVHGYVPGITYEYDINSAYPSIAAKLPCLCGKWSESKGKPNNDGKLRMCYVTVEGSNPHLGPLPYRTEDGGILRPQCTKGWYWHHEIIAAGNAGLIDKCIYHRVFEYQPCDHPAPLRGLVGLYEGRQRIGKDTPEGKAFKLVYNSVYGKLAQSLGEPIYSNPIYASLITAGCRTMILNAIATHPEGAKAVAMVATDGVYFLSPHPGLPISDALGDWDTAEKHNITLFKPGVYWDDKARDDIRNGNAPRFKARGISARDLAGSIERIDAEYQAWSTDRTFDPEWKAQGKPRNLWPSVEFTSGFTQISVLQALQWSEGGRTPEEKRIRYWRDAGRIMNEKQLRQNSDPIDKRVPYQLEYDGRVWRSQPWPGGKHWPESTPYDKRFGLDDEMQEWNAYVSDDGPVMMGFRKALGVG